MPRKKKGAGLNEHIENYIEEEEDFRPDQNLLDKHRNKYYNEYAESNRIPLKVKKPSGTMFKKSKFVINPIIVNSFNKRIEQTKLRKKEAEEAEEEEQKRQAEITRRNLEKDKKKEATQKLLTRSGAFKENKKNEDKQMANRKFIKMGFLARRRGPSKLRKTRKNPNYLSTNALTEEDRAKIIKEQLGELVYSREKKAGRRKRKKTRRKNKRRKRKKTRRKNKRRKKTRRRR